MATKNPRSTERFTTVDEVLDQDGTREAFQAVAIKEVLAWQIEDHESPRPVAKYDGQTDAYESARLAGCSILRTAT